MSPIRHLHKRANSQHWQLRLMVPKAAWHIIGRREYTKSLGVADCGAAIDLSHRILADWKTEIAVALSDGAASARVALFVPTAEQLQEAAVEVGFERATARAIVAVAKQAKRGDAAFATVPATFDRRHREAIRNRQAGDHTFWIAVARRLVRERGWKLAESEPAFSTLVNQLAVAGTDTFAWAKAFAEGKDENFTPSLLVQNTRSNRAARAAPGESIDELYSAYSAQRLAEGRMRQDTVVQGKKIIALFTEFVGPNRSLGSIQPAEVRDWRNTVASLPPAFRKYKENAGLSLREAADRAKRTGSPAVSPNTVNKYLSTVSPLFDWCRREGYVEHNPFDGLYYDLRKMKAGGKGRRPPFAVDQLNIILSSPLFSGFLENGKEWKPGIKRANDWRVWIPLVCLFTGARIGEIAQLRFEDILEQDGLPYICIRNDISTGQKTKSGTSRVSAIHSKLVALGWLEFVLRQRNLKKAAGEERLFPELAPNSRDQIGAIPSRFWRTYLTRIGIKDGADGFGSHSFRHGVADQLRAVGYLDDEIEVVLGHNQATVTAAYGKLKQGSVACMSAIIEAVDFVGVDFTNVALGE